VKILDFESSASANSATSATNIINASLQVRNPRFSVASRRFYIVQILLDNQPSHRKREEHLSINGKWRSFPKVPHLLQYIISGNYFGKVKIHGKNSAEFANDDMDSRTIALSSEAGTNMTQLMNKKHPDNWGSVCPVFGSMVMKCTFFHAFQPTTEIFLRHQDRL
jgi:hypothetical protein